MKSIPLSKGKFALVDDGDYDWLNQWKWSYMTVGYAVRFERTSLGKKAITMHALIMNTPPGMHTDHINGNKLFNLRSNLRVCTHAENQRNKRKYKNNTSGYKGVFLHRKSNKWIAKIVVNKLQIHLGYFTDATMAARAYDDADKKYNGEFAMLNFER